MPKFTKGAKLINEDGSEESLEGVEFSVRPMTNLVRIAAHRAVKALDSDWDIEIVRASVVTFKGAKAAPMFPEFSAMNLHGTLEVAAAMKTANGGDDPLEKKQS